MFIICRKQQLFRNDCFRSDSPCQISLIFEAGENVFVLPLEEDTGTEFSKPTNSSAVKQPDPEVIFHLAPTNMQNSSPPASLALSGKSQKAQQAFKV